MKKILCSLLISAQLISCGRVSTPPDRTSGDTTEMDFEADGDGNIQVTVPDEPEDNTDNGPGNSGIDPSGGGTSGGGGQPNPSGGGGGVAIDVSGFFEGLGNFAGKIGGLIQGGLGEITGENRRKKKEAEKKAKEIEGLLNEVEDLKGEIRNRAKELEGSTNGTASSDFNGEKETQDAINRRGEDHNRDIDNTRGKLPELGNKGSGSSPGDKPRERDPYPTPEKEKVRKTRDFLDGARRNVQENYSGNDRKIREGILDTADGAVDSAENSYRNGENVEGDWKLDVARRLADLAISSTPYLGDIYDIANALNGENFLTGEPIPPEEGIIQAANAIFSMASGGVIGAVGDTAKASKVLKEIAKETAKRAAKKAGRDAADPKKEKDVDDRFNRGRESVEKGSDTKKYPPDYSVKGKTKNYSSTYNSERDARAHARTQLGKDPVYVGDNKYRSQDGKWQYRSKAEDLSGHDAGDTPHVHLEKLDPATGEVLENHHLRW